MNIATEGNAFMKMEFKRKAGVLLAVSSLPSPYGIGTFGKEAYVFVDKLAEPRRAIGRFCRYRLQVMVIAHIRRCRHLQAILIL